MASPSGELPGAEQAELDCAGDCGDAGLTWLAGGEVAGLRKRAGDRWHDNDLVFSSRVGTALWAGNVRRSFRIVLAAAGLNAADWTPRELRHSFVSLMSDSGI